MSDSILLKYKTPEEKKILYEPRSGSEMSYALQNRVPIYKYSELCRFGKLAQSPARMLAHMFQRSKDNVILLQDPRDLNSGHWISVSQKPLKKEIYFFSTYGGKPDIEKLEWMKEDELLDSGQEINIFHLGLRELQRNGWEIHYNDFPYQKPRDKTAVCGIYTAAFLRSGLNPDEFEAQSKQLMKQGINPAIFYYRKYFV